MLVTVKDGEPAVTACRSVGRSGRGRGRERGKQRYWCARVWVPGGAAGWAARGHGLGEWQGRRGIVLDVQPVVLAGVPMTRTWLLWRPHEMHNEWTVVAFDVPREQPGATPPGLADARPDPSGG